MYTSEGTVLMQSSCNLFVRMFISINSRPGPKVGHVRSKTRSSGQLLEKRCELSRRHSFDPVFLKLRVCQNVCHHLILTKFETGSCQVINYVTRSIVGKKTCIHSRGHSFDPNFMKLCENVYLHQIKVTSKTWSHRVKIRS